jgi:hypothetical protein
MCPINERRNYESNRPEEPNITRFESSICFRSIQGTKRTRCSVPDTQAPFPAFFLCAATLAGRIRRGLAPMTSAPAPGPPTPWVDWRRAFDLQSPRQTLAPTLDSGYSTHDAARCRPGHDTLPASTNERGAPGSTLADRHGRARSCGRPGPRKTILRYVGGRASQVLGGSGDPRVACWSAGTSMATRRPLHPHA